MDIQTFQNVASKLPAEMAILMRGPTGVGKSHYLVAMGANALRYGKNVLHYTFELTETAVWPTFKRCVRDFNVLDSNDRMNHCN